MALYLYGVTHSNLDAPPRIAGIGAPPSEVELVRHEDLALIASEIAAADHSNDGTRALRRDMKAHADTLQAFLDHGPVLPIRFGSVAHDRETAVRDVLVHRQQSWLALLERVSDAVEIKIVGRYDEDGVLADVLKADPALLAWRERLRSGHAGYHDQLAFGQAVAAAIDQRKVQDRDKMMAALLPLADDVRVSSPTSELMVTKASFLVARANQTAFAKALDEGSAGRPLRIESVGPLPPYSFADASNSYGG